MKIKAARRRGGIAGGKGAQETHQNQDYPYTPPLRTKYATRSSTLVSPKLLPQSPQPITTCNPSLPKLLPRSPQPITSCNRSLRSALRILKKDEVTGCSSQPNVDDPVHENSLEDIKFSTPIGSPSVAGLLAGREIGLNVSQPSREKDSEVQSQEHTLEKCRTEDVLRSSSRCPSQAWSFNLTEYARGLQENSDEDEEEVNSDPNHEYVDGHRVKKEIAGLVRAIFNKYGDLTKESEKRSHKFISFFLESVCDIYQKLEKAKLIDLTIADISGMIVELQDLQKDKLKVGWLLEKLQHIYKTKTSTLRYLEIKKEAEKCAEFKKRIEKELEEGRMHMTLIQKKISAAEKEMIANEAKAKEYVKMELYISAKVHALAKQSLVHDLL